MRVFIAEDEGPARERLIEALSHVVPSARVVGAVGSVRDARAWLERNPRPDLLLLDIQLADGLSLELFDGKAPSVPVIFTTAYDEYVLEAFRAQAIDYLLKPIDEARLAQALDKHTRLLQHFADNIASLLTRLHPQQGRRSRILGRLGSRYVAVPLSQAAYFISSDKLCFVVTEGGERILLDTPLADLEQELDPDAFFRANRQCIVSAKAVKGFRAAGKGRLVLMLSPDPRAEVLVSQERAQRFREWLES